MIKVILAIALLSSCISCNQTPIVVVAQPNNNHIKVSGLYPEFRVVIVDSCEYIFLSDYNDGSGHKAFTHKGNCRYCLQRNKK